MLVLLVPVLLLLVLVPVLMLVPVLVLVHTGIRPTCQAAVHGVPLTSQKPATLSYCTSSWSLRGV
jgi:hypothetical protein